MVASVARPALRSAARRFPSRTTPSAGSAAAAPCSAPIGRQQPRRLISTTLPTRQQSSSSSSDPQRTTHFGFEDGLSETEKTERVAGVFHSVADSYDRMNDLMSFGWHRVWKDHFVSSLNPGLSPSSNTSSGPLSPPKPQRILDIAGGTGDIAFRMLHTAHILNGNPDVTVTMSDINPSMLAVGRSRAASQLPASQQSALSFLVADATSLPPEKIPDNSIDLYTVAFGIRNFSNIPQALLEARRVLKPGGVFACLEFSKVDKRIPFFDAIYKRWSFSAIPLVGQLVTGDRDSYQYLVESIERFPSQERFRDMISEAGFEVPGGLGYENLTGGVAAIHKGMKPI